MRFLLALSIAGLALVAGAFVERAKADQAFLCDGGRIVYARGGADLDRLRATDPCVAGYFGQAPLRGADRSDASPPPQRSTAAPAASSARVPDAPTRTAADAAGSAESVTVRIVNGRPGADTWVPGSH